MDRQIGSPQRESRTMNTEEELQALEEAIPETLEEIEKKYGYLNWLHRKLNEVKYGFDEKFRNDFERKYKDLITFDDPLYYFLERDGVLEYYLKKIGVLNGK